MSINQIIKEFVKSSSTINYLLGRDKVRGWLQTLKKRFQTAHHVWFGCLNDQGEFGICENEAEYMYTLTRYFSFIKGTIIRASTLKEEAQQKGLLLGVKSQPFMLPAPVVEPKKKS